MTSHSQTRTPFGAHTTPNDKVLAGRTEISETQVEIRDGGNDVDPNLQAWIYERLGRQLGKFAPQIERILVRFGDDNGPRGGLDKCCLVHVMLASLPSVVVEMRGETEREAFDLAAGRAERATRRSMEKHGFSSKLAQKRRERPHGHDHGELEGMQTMESSEDEPLQTEGGEAEESIMGRWAGHGPDQQMIAQERPEKVRRDMPVDTSLPGTSASDRKVGYGHTAKRNTKLNTAGMTRALEDSTTDRPSRKSTRGGTNRVKPDNPLTRRVKAAVMSPQSQAGRATTRGH